MRKKTRRINKYLISLFALIILGFVFVLYFLILPGISKRLDRAFFQIKFPNFLNRNTIVNPFISNNTLDKLRDELKKKNIEYEEISELADGSGIEVKVKGGVTVFFSKSKDLTLQISSLQTLLRQLTIDTIEDGATVSGSIGKIKKIDFRLDRPIVGF